MCVLCEMNISSLGSDDTLAILEELVNTNKFRKKYMLLFLHHKLTKFNCIILGSNNDVGNAIWEIMFSRCKVRFTQSSPMKWHPKVRIAWLSIIEEY